MLKDQIQVGTAVGITVEDLPLTATPEVRTRLTTALKQDFKHMVNPHGLQWDFFHTVECFAE